MKSETLGHLKSSKIPPRYVQCTHYTRIHYSMNTSLILLLALMFRHLKAPQNIAQIQIS